jgi:hypothetical protein
MENTVGNLLSLCSSFKERVSTYISLHKRNRKTLQYHLQLLELLEVPQLIEGCIRNGFYDEAIELANFIYSLERRHLLATEVKASVNQSNMSGTSYPLASSEPTTPATTSGKEGEEGNKKERNAAVAVSSSSSSSNEGQAVIQKIVNEISDILLNLSSSLLFQLTELSSLPKQIQILSILRKMDSLIIDRILSLERFDALQHVQQQQQTQLQQQMSSLSSASLSSSSFDDHQQQGIKTPGGLENNRSGSVSGSGKDDSQHLRDIIRQQFLQNSEIKHQMDFLEAKNVWLQRNLENYSSTSATGSGSSLSEKSSHSHSTGAAGGIAASSSQHQHHRLGPYGKAVEMLEIRRTSFYSIITQYHALFTDYYQMTLSSSSSSSTANKATSATGTASAMKKKQDGSSAVSSSQQQQQQQSSSLPIVIDDHYPQWTCSLILKAWMTRQIETLLSELKSLLLAIDDGSSIRSLFEQSLYFASRLGTVGCDFTALLIPLFEDISLNKFKKEMEANYQHWIIILKNEKIDLNASKMIPSILKTENIIVSQAPPGSEQLIPLYHSQDLHPVISDNNATLSSSSSSSSSMSISTSSITASENDFSPSSSLMKYPPLVFFLNNCLLALNYYRDFPLVTLYHEICLIFHSYFQKILSYLVENHLMIREKGNKYFGEGYMSNLGTSSTTSSSSKSATKNNPKATNSSTVVPLTTITEKLDCDYAESIACDIIPHIYTCLLLSFRKLTFSTIKSYCLKHNFSASTSGSSSTTTHSLNTSKHFLNDLKQSKELFGIEITSYIEEYWKLLLSSKLLDEKNVILTKKTTSNVPFVVPPVVPSVVPPVVPPPLVPVVAPPAPDSSLSNEPPESPVAVINLENKVGLVNLATLSDDKDTIKTETSSQF